MIKDIHTHPLKRNSACIFRRDFYRSPQYLLWAVGRFVMIHHSISYGGIADTALDDSRYCHHWWQLFRPEIVSFSHWDGKYYASSQDGLPRVKGDIYYKDSPLAINKQHR